MRPKSALVTQGVVCLMRLLLQHIAQVLDLGEDVRRAVLEVRLLLSVQ